MTDLEVEILRRMTPAKKLAVMMSLICQAYELKASVVRAQWPDLPPEEVRLRAWAMVAGDGS